MKNLYDAGSYQELVSRVQSLQPDSQRQWGKMNPAQMMAHCKEAFGAALSDKPHKRLFIGYLFGWIAKKQFVSDKPWKKNLPTAPVLKIEDERSFETEKKNLLDSMGRFVKEGPARTNGQMHPFFGRMTAEEWGKGMYKHLDHHLQQFGV
jgi:hypothetical protein